MNEFERDRPQYGRRQPCRAARRLPCRAVRRHPCRTVRWHVLAAALALVAAGCAGTQAPPPEAPVPGTYVPGLEPPTPELPSVPTVRGPLQLELVYPFPDATLTARDSTFVFGSAGTGAARVSVNGTPVEVAANGAFLAFLPVPSDGRYRVHAVAGGDSATVERTVGVPPDPAVPVAGGIVPGSAYPRGTWAVQAGQAVEVGFRAPPGGEAWVLLPSGRRVRLHEMGAEREVSFRDSFTEELTTAAPVRVARYAALVPAEGLSARDTTLAEALLGAPRPSVAETPADSVLERCRDAAEVAGRAAGRLACPPAGVLQRAPLAAADQVRPGEAVLEFAHRGSRAVVPLPLTLTVLDPEVPRVGVAAPATDADASWRIRGRPNTSGPFHWFWPEGTLLTLTGQRDGMLQVRMSRTLAAWVPAGDVRILPEGHPGAGGAVDAVRFTPRAEWLELRIPLPERMPYDVRVDQGTLTVDVYGAVSTTNYFRYGGMDPMLARAEWTQPEDSVFRVTAHLAQPLWGWDAAYDAAGALVVRIRRAPVVDPARPLAGLLVAVDAGHPPGGAIGPTGYTEAAANLGIARALERQLQAAGARVLMSRTDSGAVPLGARPAMALEADAHLLVSIHNDAFPDGVNPFENTGSGVYYYHPHAADLASAILRELLAELGLRDLGLTRGDLALARPEWMPAVLTESAFLMVPRQEAALRDPAVQERIAAAHLRGLEAFVRARARR